jgi:hypothetical protein
LGFPNWSSETSATIELAKLVDVFNEAEDPALAFKQAATKASAKISMALAMSHGEEVNRERVDASLVVD